MRLRDLFRWFRGDEDQIPHWTRSRATQAERQTLERAGLAGHHFQWSRTIAAKYKRRTSETLKFRRSA